MFLRKDNSIKWKFLAIAAVVVIALCLAGVLWLDRPVFEFFRQFNWKIWGIFDVVFAAKIWLGATFIISAVIFIINCVKTRMKNKIPAFKFNLVKAKKCFIEKSKTNKVFLIFYSVLLASIIDGVLKVSLGRARPIFYEALGQTGFYPFHAEWAFNSMPSGHVVASFAGLVMVGLFFPKWKWATWTGAILIGVSRICYGAHWPSDVLLGAFIGMVSADFVYRWARAKKV